MRANAISWRSPKLRFARDQWIAEPDIVGDRSAERKSILLHDADTSPEFAASDIPDRSAVESDFAVTNVKEALNRLDHTSLRAWSSVRTALKKLIPLNRG